MAHTHLDVNALISRVKRDNYGYLTANDIGALASHPDTRLTQVLIRAGGCRLTCAAQDAHHIAECLLAGGDYVRDISFPVERAS